MIKPRVPKTDYSKIAEYYDRVRTAPVDILLEKIIEYGKIDANCTILDIGCGTGRFPIGISTRTNIKLCALEPSAAMLKQALAKEKSEDILWVRGDGQKLPFRDNSFNCIYMTLVIHHIENKESALREIYRVLRRKGNCVIMTVSHSRIRKHILHDFPEVTRVDLSRFPSVPSIRKLMTKIGFRNVHLHFVEYDEGYVTTEEYLEKVRKKYISTLSLLSEEAFQRGLGVFERRVKRKHGSQIRRTVGFDFVVGRKSQL